jgi:Methyltransferase domain
VVAIESKSHNIEAARRSDITARLARKKMTLRNKKRWRASGLNPDECRNDHMHKQQPALHDGDSGRDLENTRQDPLARNGTIAKKTPSCGSIKYVEQKLSDGNLGPVLTSLTCLDQSCQSSDNLLHQVQPQLLVVSIHSCGNLVHHGLRSIVLNDAVKAVAMIGCCYNLATERLGGPT